MTRLFAWIGGRSSKAYAALYLAAIPIFAFIYWQFFPASFYAPYAKLEEAVVVDLQRIATTLDTAMHRNLDVPSIVVGEWRLGTFSLSEPTSPEGTKLSFKILAVFSKIGVVVDDPASIEGLRYKALSVFLIGSEKLLVHGFGRTPYPKINRTDNVAFVLRPITIDSTTESVELREFEQDFLSKITVPFYNKARAIRLTPEEDKELESLMQGIRGDPTTISLGFLRMAYFSTTVITTIGFGDIVPITPLARLVVSIEGILGIVLAGLFVNATMRA